MQVAHQPEVDVGSAVGELGGIPLGLTGIGDPVLATVDEQEAFARVADDRIVGLDPGTERSDGDDVGLVGEVEHDPAAEGEIGRASCRERV